MTVLITGRAASGKSSFAEDLALKMNDDVIYYLATMKVMDKEGEERVKRHKKMREGKGFVTLERERDICDAFSGREPLDRATLLLECVTNLLGNEIHDGGLTGKDAAEKVLSDITELSEKFHNTIIVTGIYDEDGEGYDDGTREYVKSLNGVNAKLKSVADRTYDMSKGES